MKLLVILQTGPLTLGFFLNLALDRTALEFPVFWKGSLQPHAPAPETKLWGSCLWGFWSSQAGPLPQWLLTLPRGS